MPWCCLIRSQNLVSSLHWFQSPWWAFHMKCQRLLLQIKSLQFIRNEDISATTSLPSSILLHSPIPSVTGVTPFLAMQPDCQTTFQPTRHSTVTSTYRSVDHQAVSGDAAQAVTVADGSMSSGQIPTFHLQTSGGVLSTVVTEGRRYGACRLSHNNNNKRECMVGLALFCW